MSIAAAGGLLAVRETWSCTQRQMVLEAVIPRQQLPLIPPALLPLLPNPLLPKRLLHGLLVPRPQHAALILPALLPLLSNPILPKRLLHGLLLPRPQHAAVVPRPQHAAAVPRPQHAAADGSSRRVWTNYLKLHSSTSLVVSHTPYCM